MAMGDPYATLAQLKKRAGVPLSNTNEDDAMNSALAAASESVNRVTHRQFQKDDTPSPRVFAPNGPWEPLAVHDFHTTTGLVIATDDDLDGAFETTWAASDYQLEPLNGIVDEVSGWPFSMIRPSWYSVGFPCGWWGNRQMASVQVTAAWGWAAVPSPVVEATLIVAAELWKLKDAPLGVAGLADFGVLRVRENPMAARKLVPYMKDPVLVA